jgi:hypothetical protein
VDSNDEATIPDDNTTTPIDVPLTYENYTPTNLSDLISSGMDIIDIFLVIFKNIWLLWTWNS